MNQENQAEKNPLQNGTAQTPEPVASREEAGQEVESAVKEPLSQPEKEAVREAWHLPELVPHRKPHRSATRRPEERSGLSWDKKAVPAGTKQRLRRRKRAKYSPVYLIQQAFIGLWRNFGMSIASVLVLLACLLTTGSFYALIKNLNYNLDDLGQMNQIVVYMNESCTTAQVEGAKGQIAAFPDVEGTTIITKEQALAEEKDKYAAQYPHLFESLSEADNPYRDSIVITYLPGTQVGDLETRLAAVEGVANLVSRADIAESVASMKNGISLVFAGFMVILFVVTLFVIIMTIRLAVFARSKEIMIMRYVGATRSFIMTPFLLEGVFMGVIAALCSFVLQRYLYGATDSLLTTDYDLLQVMPFHDLGLTFLFGFLLIGIVTGAVGSWISLRRYLKV